MDIRNKNELRRRIDAFLHEYTHEEYILNEEFCKDTMRMMADFIGHANGRMDSERKRLTEARQKLKEALLENKVLHEYNYNGSSGICRAKLMGSMTGAWHIGNVVCVENGKSFMLMQDGYSEENGHLILRAMEVIPETIQRFACVEDMTGERLFEGDVICNPEHRTVRMEICYGKYAAYCPNDQEYMETVGFYAVSNTTDDAMPLGPTKEYALLLGNVIDNPDLRVV